MTKDDLFNVERRSMKIYSYLENNTFSKYESDNTLLKAFIDAKFQGNYRHILYDCNCPEKTIHKNLVVFRKILRNLNKPLEKLTDKDLISLQSKLNQNRILSERDGKPISHSYKYDMVKCFKQFWTFYRAYAKFELGKTIEDISEYFRIRKQKNVNRLVEFLTKEEIEKLASYTQNQKMRALIKLFFETGARTIEILNLKKYNCEYLNGRWKIKLPNMKGMSTAKMPIEIDYSHNDFDAWMKTNNFSEDDYIFDYTYDHLRLTFTKLGRKALNRKISPKLFRKSCAMHLVNLDINEQYIKSHMGWSASSKAIAHYISQKAIKKPEKLRDSFDQKPVSEIDDLKEKLKVMEQMIMKMSVGGV